ncbi:unnamed protein product [Cuscuta europaea]|uniref:SWIM-type domain-containing protein n=1 Tax=Cuscuta europaea TaxID=41803 RepID=A0A9P0YJV5_CUSEU|nr:unnamed protein product [Cuscuta europaea]
MSMQYGISMSYNKAWKAQKKAMQLQFGSDLESYKLLPSMAYVLEKTNPGSMFNLVTGKDDAFSTFFMSFKPWIEAWPYCRPVLILDGSFMKAYYKGTLLTACCQDANDHIVPIAFGICGSETKASWKWFLSKVCQSIKYRHDLYVVSDRHKGLIKAVSELLPHASHGFCVAHLGRNITSKFRGSAAGLGWKFKAAYMAATMKEYDDYLSMLDSEDPGIRHWLDKLGANTWSKVMSGPKRYNIMPSNCAESMNKVNVCAREYSVSKLVDFLRERMQQWFTERKDKAEKTSTILTKKCEKRLVAMQAESTRMKVKPSCAYEFEVVDSRCKSFVVNLNSRSCTCGHFQLDQFVCVHDVAAIGIRPHLSCYTYISPYYTRDAWLATWSGIMHPIADPDSWSIPATMKNQRCKPPSCLKRPPGRPKKCRIPSIGEYRGSKRQKCSRCHVLGHNKKTCRNPIPINTQ